MPNLIYEKYNVITGLEDVHLHLAKCTCKKASLNHAQFVSEDFGKKILQMKEKMWPNKTGRDVQRCI